MLSLLMALTLSQQAAALQSLDILEHETVPLRRSTGVMGVPEEALRQDGWTRDEAEQLMSASSSMTARAIGIGLAGGALLAAGTGVSDALDPSVGVWVGLLSSVVSFAALSLGLAWAVAPGSSFVPLLEGRDRRLRNAARSTSEWDPAVVSATRRLIGFGRRDERDQFLRDEQVVTEEQLTQLSPDPVEHERGQQRARAGATGAVLLMLGGGLVVCAPPVILGATRLPPLAGIGISLGAWALSLVMLLIAQPVAQAAEASEAATLDAINAAVFAEARRALARPPPPPVEPPTPAPSMPAE